MAQLHHSPVDCISTLYVYFPNCSFQQLLFSIWPRFQIFPAFGTAATIFIIQCSHIPIIAVAFLYILLHLCKDFAAPIW